jgi:O-succinylbenzoate synthase
VKIDRIRLLRVEIPLRFPFETSFGCWTSRETLLVTAEGEGLVGYGEVTAHETPYYSYETLNTAADIIRSFLAPAMLGIPVASPDDIAPRMAAVRGHPMAKAGVEGAVRDVLAQHDGISLSAQIGGTRSRVEAGVSLGIEPSPDALVARIRPFAERGYRRVKLKIRPDWDLEPMESVRRAFPDLPLAADANAAYSLTDADHLAHLDEFALTMLEQPLAWDDLVDHAALSRELRTPICLDESLTGIASARSALELGAGSIFNIKLGRVGGMTAAVAIHDLARGAAVPVWCGGMLETCVGRLHNLALASLPGFVMPGDLSGTDRYFELDLVSPPIRVNRDGTLDVPEAPGLGRSVDEAALRAVTRDEQTIPGGR